MVDERTIIEWTADNRRLVADTVDSLTPAQQEAETLCEGWSVRVVTAHLLQPILVSPTAFLWDVVKARGSMDRACDVVSRRIAERPVAELTAMLREQAATPARVPTVGLHGPFTDACIHLRDIARPLGLDVDVPLNHWRAALEFIVTKNGRNAFVPKAFRKPFDLMTLRATDQDWMWGHGPHKLFGPSEALAMALSGRRVGFDDLRGSAGSKLLLPRLPR